MRLDSILKYSQSTDSEHEHQGELLLLGDIDCDQSRNGDDKNDEIGGDVHARIGEPQAGLAQTEALNGGVPELGDRDAVQERTNHSPSAVDGKDGDHDPTDDAHAVRGEYSEVLQ